MLIVFVSNFLSPHQLSFCDELKKANPNFIFVSAGTMPDEKKKMGYFCGNREYEINFFKNKKYCRELFLKADLLLFGSVDERLFLKRLKSKKITIRISERFYKTEIKNFFLTRLKQWYHHTRFSKYNLYYFADSAYLPNDLLLFNNNYKNRIYKWSYFPFYNVDRKFNKTGKIIKLIWVGRMVSWKHPEVFVTLCEYLERQNYNFTATMIGDGDCFNYICNLVNEKKLDSRIKILGFQPNEITRQEMNNSDIFIATSDRNEGWGAVINEAMNCGCVVIASDLMGAAPYLLDNKTCGFTYNYEDITSLFKICEKLLINKNLIDEIKNAAFEEINKKWSPVVAVNRLIAWYKSISKSNMLNYENGLLSPAERYEKIKK